MSETISKREEECDDNVRRSWLREDFYSIGNKYEDFEVVSMITKFLVRYNNDNPTESIGGFIDDEDALIMGGDGFGEENLTHVLYESQISLYEDARKTCLVAVLFVFMKFSRFWEYQMHVHVNF